MKILLRYLREKRKAIALVMTFAFSTAVVFYLYNLPAEALFYIYAFGITITAARAVCGFLRMRKKHYILLKHAEMEQIYTLDMPESELVVENDYQKLVNKLITEKNELNARQTKSMTEMKDYYTMWAHQIKTPISAMNLLLQVMKTESENDDQRLKELSQELFKTEFYVEAVLQYLRLEDMSSDFKFDHYNLEPIVKQSVKKYASQFIHRKIKIELGCLNESVLTDEKWISFVLEQLISNAIKYTKEGGTVKIYLQETCNINDRVLVIEDNGIGISDEDLPRIFERGFTGYNGRMDKKSTGIGLYLCKKALVKLSHKISIESEYGVGTKVMIDMSESLMRHE